MKKSSETESLGAEGLKNLKCEGDDKSKGTKVITFRAFTEDKAELEKIYRESGIQHKYVTRLILEILGPLKYKLNFILKYPKIKGLLGNIESIYSFIIDLIEDFNIREAELEKNYNGQLNACREKIAALEKEINELKGIDSEYDNKSKCIEKKSGNRTNPDNNPENQQNLSKQTEEDLNKTDLMPPCQFTWYDGLIKINEYYKSKIEECLEREMYYEKTIRNLKNENTLLNDEISELEAHIEEQILREKLNNFRGN